MAGCIVEKGRLIGTVALKSPVKAAGGCRGKTYVAPLIAELRAEGKIVSVKGNALLIYAAKK